MKKFLLAAAVLLATTSFAQNSVRFGIKAGGNLSFSKIDIQNISINGKSDFGYWGVGLVELSLKSPESKLKLQLEALYSNNTIKFEVNGLTSKIALQQINIPLLAKYFITPALSINVGPTFNFNVAGKETADTSGVKVSQKINEELNSFQIGLAAGATYYIHKGLFIDARYNPLFGQVNKKEDNNDIKMRMSTISLGVGYKF